MTTTQLLDPADQPDFTEFDERLRPLDREDILKLGPELRMRWFYLLQVFHPELARVSDDLHELLEPNNEVKIISIVGMTGIGKTTLATNLLHSLNERFEAEGLAHEVPFIYVSAPANGERSMSWTVLYKRILAAGAEVLVEKKRRVKIEDGELKIATGRGKLLAQLREYLELMLKNRHVRVLVIDEAYHLMRFEEYSAIMDTLKSLADIHDTKLVLIGNFDVAKLMVEYGQVARRSEIIHYKRYKLKMGTESENLTADEQAFADSLQKFEKNWPCAVSPNLSINWRPLMAATLGSVGLLKSLLLRLASLQMASKGEKLTEAMLRKAAKSPRSLREIETETTAGEESIKDACYGDHIFDKALVTQMLSPFMEKTNA